MTDYSGQHDGERFRVSPPAEGFTLLEVLVATVVMGTAVAALFSLLSGSLRNTRRIEFPNRALMLGESTLNRLLVSRDEAPEDSGAERLQLDGMLAGRWDQHTRWEARAAKLKPTELVSVGAPVPVRIQFDIFWRREDAGSENKISLETMQIWREPSTGNQ